MSPVGAAPPRPTGLEAIAARVKAALWGMYIGDALAMPVHWYYDRARIFRDFPPNGIVRYEAPVATFPGSIMSLSNTGGGGRGVDASNLIGDVLVKGKKRYWARDGPGYHYHHGMKPGENTLDTLVARLMLQTFIGKRRKLGEDVARGATDDAASTAPLVAPEWMSEAERNFRDAGPPLRRRDPRRMPPLASAPGAGGSSPGSARRTPFTTAFLAAYIRFMTTKDSHPDVYVATAHRMFFANLAGGTRGFSGGRFLSDPFECADNDGHNTDSVDGLINVGVVSLNQLWVEAVEQHLGSGSVETGENTSIEILIHDAVNMIRRSRALPAVGLQYHRLLRKLVLEGTPLRQAIVELVRESPDAQSLTAQMLETFGATAGDSGANDPMSACYVGSNWPVTLLMAYKYHDSLPEALLAGANAGGENVNRNALLGAIMGAALGDSPEGQRDLETWRQGLQSKEQLEIEIDMFVEELLGARLDTGQPASTEGVASSTGAGAAAVARAGGGLEL